MPAAKTPSQAVRQDASEIWQYFTKEGAARVRCNRCPKGFKRSSSYHSTTQFWKHLRHHHLDVFVSTQYCKEGLETQNLYRLGKRVSRLGGQPGNGTAADEVADTYAALVANAYAGEEGDVGNEQAAVVGNPAGLVDSAQDFQTADAADNEQPEDPAPHAVDHSDAAIPDVHLENEPVLAQHALLDMLRLRAQQLQQSLFQPPQIAAPQPLPMPSPQVQAAENDLVETSGRAMILRLRQLYEKDAKLFLRAQNDIDNAIFQYEVEHM